MSYKKIALVFERTDPKTSLAYTKSLFGNTSDFSSNDVRVSSSKHMLHRINQTPAQTQIWKTLPQNSENQSSHKNHLANACPIRVDNNHRRFAKAQHQIFPIQNKKDVLFVQTKTALQATALKKHPIQKNYKNSTNFLFSSFFLE